MEEIETNDGHFHRCKWLIDNAEGKILDIGCADGFMFRDKPEKDVTFLDKNDVIPKSYTIKFIRANVDNQLPMADDTFDTAVVGDMLEHVKNPVFAIQEAYRVAKKVVITVPNEWEWDETKRPFMHADHVRFYNEALIRRHLKEAGIDNYELIKIYGGGWSFFCIGVYKK